MRFADEQVYEPDDGRLIGEVSGVSELIAPRLGGGLQLGVEVLDQLDHRLRGSERPADAFKQLLLRDGDQLNRHAVGYLEILEHLRRSLSGDGHAQQFVRDLQRENLPLLEVVGLEHLGDGELRLQQLYVHERRREGIARPPGIRHAAHASESVRADGSFDRRRPYVSASSFPSPGGITRDPTTRLLAAALFEERTRVNGDTYTTSQAVVPTARRPDDGCRWCWDGRQAVAPRASGHPRLARTPSD